MAFEDPDIGPTLLSEEQLQARIVELGQAISVDYAGRKPLLVCVLKGAFVFMADLCRVIDLPVEVDFMAVSSYGNSTKTSGVVRIIKDLEIDLGGRDVVVVEDIVDSGLTLDYLRRTLAARHPASLEVCALFVREGSTPATPVKYIGFEIPPEFVIGYGLDLAERYRNLRYLATYIGPTS